MQSSHGIIQTHQEKYYSSGYWFFWTGYHIVDSE